MVEDDCARMTRAGARTVIGAFMVRGVLFFFLGCFAIMCCLVGLWASKDIGKCGRLG